MLSWTSRMLISFARSQLIACKGWSQGIQNCEMALLQSLWTVLWGENGPKYAKMPLYLWWPIDVILLHGLWVKYNFHCWCLAFFHKVYERMLCQSRLSYLVSNIPNSQRCHNSAKFFFTRWTSVYTAALFFHVFYNAYVACINLPEFVLSVSFTSCCFEGALFTSVCLFAFSVWTLSLCRSQFVWFVLKDKFE